MSWNGLRLKANEGFSYNPTTQSVGVGNPSWDSGVFDGIGMGGGITAPAVGVSYAPSIAESSLLDDSFLKGMLGGKDSSGNITNGWAGTALGIAQGLGNFYLGSQQLKLAKEAFGLKKEYAEKNWQAQKNLTNSSLEERQRARIASREGAATNPYQSVGDYMKQYGVR